MTTVTTRRAKTTKVENVATELVRAIDVVWQGIRRRHTDVPDVMITVGSGTLGAKPGQARLGHFAAARWQREGESLPELFVSGEGLQRGATDVLGTLLHEAAHGLASVREIKDTSRQGRYHNKRFKDLGAELGLELTEDPSIGWSITSVPAATAAEYAEELAALTAALVIYRHAEIRPTSKSKSTNLAVAVCLCPRKIRVAKSTLAEAPITCGKCGADFEAEDEDE